MKGGSHFAALPPHSAEGLRPQALRVPTSVGFFARDENARLKSVLYTPVMDVEAQPRRETKKDWQVRRSLTALCGGEAAKASSLRSFMTSIRPFARAALFSLLLISLAAAATSLSFPFPVTRAQEASPSPPATRIDSTELHRALVDLTNSWTVMCIAAHPDDEDGTSLTVLRRKYGVHTVSVFSTFGEGGQNAVGPQLYEELGVIRARETMAAAEIQGSEPYFLGLKDFGFSKSADEAFRVWGHEEALRRMVLKIRELRPDVIITNHDTTSGHGHHQATGRLLLEAFEAAADPKRFPDQLKDDVQPWQVKRIFVRAGFGNNTPAQKPENEGALVAIDPNERDAIRGTTYAEQALRALQKHETQGPWPKSVADMARFRNSPDGRLPLIRYRLTREAKDTAPLPPNAATFLDGLQLPEAVAAALSLPPIAGHPLIESENKPDSILDVLTVVRQAHGFTSANPDEAPRFRLMNERLNHAFALLSGVTVTLSANDAVLVPGTPTVFSINLANNGKLPVTINKLSLRGWGSERQLEIADQLPAGTEAAKTIENVTPKDANISVPSAGHLYDGRLLGESFVATAEVELDGAKFSVNTESKLDVAPAVEIRSISPSPYVWTPGTSRRPISFKVQVANHLTRSFNGTLSISSTNNRIIGTGRKLSLDASEAREATLESSALPLDLLKGRGTRRRSLSESGSILLSVRSADSADAITTDSVQVVYADARVVHGLHVGFVPSFDQTLESSLSALGVAAKKLSVADIQNSDLKPYDTIIIDNRGYEAHPELVAANDRLLSYVQNGGTLIVFYHKNNEWNPDPRKNRPQLAPYPLTLGGERVTDENALVSFLQPRHRLLNFPNKIKASDFAGWVQERGLYYPKEWDSHYVALLAMNDPGEPSLRGGLLVGDYSRGQYIYTSMVWYRELRAGVPGAYRMLANMISYGHR
jgi:LmbE family N-acetylglucosaminyl deacetylase